MIFKRIQKLYVFMLNNSSRRFISIFLVNSILLFTPSLSKGNVLEDANDAYDNKDYVKALRLYDQVLLEEPNNLDVIYWASIAADAEKKIDKRIDYLKMLKEADSNGIMPRAMLIHSYQEKGDFEKREKEHKDIINLWKKLKVSGTQDVNGYKRDVFNVSGKNINAIEYFDVQGRFPIRYRFTPQINENKIPFVIMLDKFGRNSNLYYLDIFDGKHRFRHYTFNQEPSYDEVRKKVISILNSGDFKKGAKSYYPYEVKLEPWINENYIEAFKQTTDRYLFEKVVLPKIFFQDPKRFFDLLNKNKVEYLKDIIFDVQTRVEEKDQKIDINGISYLKVGNIGSEIYLIKLPIPKNISEAYYIGIFSNKKTGNRYFYFKKIDNILDMAILTEITINKVILHGSAISNPTKTSFFKEILKVI